MSKQCIFSYRGDFIRRAIQEFERQTTVNRYFSHTPKFDDVQSLFVRIRGREAFGRLCCWFRRNFPQHSVRKV